MVLRWCRRTNRQENAGNRNQSHNDTPAHLLAVLTGDWSLNHVDGVSTGTAILKTTLQTEAWTIRQKCSSCLQRHLPVYTWNIVCNSPNTNQCPSADECLKKSELHEGVLRQQGLVRWNRPGTEANAAWPHEAVKASFLEDLRAVSWKTERRLVGGC